MEAFLSDSRKITILDHPATDNKTRRSLTKISLETRRPVNAEADQHRIYLKQLKTEIN